MVTISHIIAKRMPKLRGNLVKAHMKDKPEEFVKKNLKLALGVSITFVVLAFFAFDKMEINLLMLIPVFALSATILFLFFMSSLTVAIRKRRREIDQEVLFAGRYLLVKLEAGSPLFNALIDASKSYGVCGKYFKEMTDEIMLGTPIEEVLEKSREFNASEKFKMILSEILTTLKSGADVTSSLKEVLDQITTEQVIEIKAYSKKVNALILMYMIVGTVIPSLGMTMFIIIAGFAGLDIPPIFMFIVLLVLTFVQFLFVALFKSARPVVNL